MTLLHEYIREAIESAPVRMRLDMPIPADLHAIHEIFQDVGQELYIVGGAVRDVLLDKSPKDYDLATGATPDVVQDILGQDPSNKVDLTGKSFGVVRVRTADGNEYEIATFRKDIGAGRRPDAVEFTSIQDDVKRRDLTINALFYDMNSGEVVDYVGGIGDVKSGVVKAVGDPRQRFGEDRLRILRAVRFAGRLGSDLDPETEKAILDDNDLSGVSPERIRDEVVKGVSQAHDVGHFLGMLADLNLYSQVLPGLRVNSGAGTSTRDVAVQLALVLSDNDPDQVRSVLRNMKYTNDEVSVVNFLMRFPTITRETAPGMKKEFNRIKLDPERLKEFGRSAGGEQKIIPAFLKFVASPPAANPRDLMSQGLKGPEIGSAMQSAESDAYEQMLRELLQKYVRNLLLEYAASDEVVIDVSSSDIEEAYATGKSDGDIRGTIMQDVPLYRVIDDLGLSKIRETGKITPGDFAVPIESEKGAQFGFDLDDVIKFGLAQNKQRWFRHDVYDSETGELGPKTYYPGRLRGGLWVLEANAAFTPFYTMSYSGSNKLVGNVNPFANPGDKKFDQVTYDIIQAYLADKSKENANALGKHLTRLNLRLSKRGCDTGLGCSIDISSSDIIKVHKVEVDDSGGHNLVPMAIIDALGSIEGKDVSHEPTPFDPIKELLIRRYIHAFLCESFEQIIRVHLRVRVDTDKPTEPTMQDVLTDIRGLRNVITVRQVGKQDPAPEHKKYADLVVGFEDDKTLPLSQLEKEIVQISGVDMAIIQKIENE
jgi:tRNA nucleotidyltransferase/poly(A) polymerase